MDYDMKRKPIQDSFYTDKVTIDGVEYEIAHFKTEPFNNVAEFRHYRDTKELCTKNGALRTEADWKVFFQKLQTKNTNSKVRDLNWSILNSCIMGHRAGAWTIPGLQDKTIKEKCDWINMHNSSKRRFKESDWKNARRPERQVNMLPFDMIKEKLYELMTA